MISDLKSLSYPEKLVEVGLQSLEDMRLSYDLSHTYSTLNGLVDVDPGTWFTRVHDVSPSNTSLSDKL